MMKTQFLLSKLLVGRNLHSPDFHTATLNDTAALLAKFHRCTMLGLVTARVPPEPLTVLTDLKRKIIQNAAKSRAIKAVVLNLIERKINLVEAICKIRMPAKKLPIFYLTRGDFHNENILFLPNQAISGILDFEKTHLGDGLYDVLHFIRLLFGKTWPTDTGIAPAQLFVRHYLKKIRLINSPHQAFGDYLMVQLSAVFLNAAFL